MGIHVATRQARKIDVADLPKRAVAGAQVPGANSVSAPVVVVAEDEAMIRELVVLALMDAGFEVVETQDGGEALTALEARESDVTVLFSDIHMPGSPDGLALANYARHRWPNLGIVLASGRATPDLTKLPEGCRFFPKPYALDDVVRHLRNVVGGSRG
jgi:two-component system, response regulator PdtaR